MKYSHAFDSHRNFHPLYFVSAGESR